MARSIAVRYGGEVRYTIELRRDFSELPAMLESLGYGRDRRVCIITDSNVDALYGDEVQSLLSKSFGTVIRHVFPAGEESKNLSTVQGAYEALLSAHFDRKDLLVALGGGVVGDLTGFVAATYLRGIDFVQAPTTLLSQVDSSIGGKTGVDFLQYKNMVGAFYMPRLVYMNLSALETLPKIQIVSGMGEIIKHGLIRDAAYYGWLGESRGDILALLPEAVERMIEKSCNIKREVVEADPTEKGERALLNFGHTIGHAVEKLCGFSRLHGECVGIGMVAASYISHRAGNITAEELGGIRDCLLSFGFNLSFEGISPSDVLSATKSDKKMDGKSIKFILLSKIGEAKICRDLSDGEILEGIEYALG